MALVDSEPVEVPKGELVSIAVKKERRDGKRSRDKFRAKSTTIDESHKSISMIK